MATGEQKSVSLRSSLKEDMTDGIEEEEEETRDVLYQYVFRRANEDSRLSGQQSTTFQIAEEQVGTTRSSSAALVGRRLAELGDEIDSQYHDEMEELVQMSGTPETAFAMFHEVVKHLFDWNEDGGARINVGRIAALLAYCYHLCRTYIHKNLTGYGLASFLSVVAGWLIRFLLKAKFYEWLQKQGGWGQFLAMTTGGWGNNVFLVIGVASLAIWAFSYFRGK